jgi:hypothetical protein
MIKSFHLNKSTNKYILPKNLKQSSILEHITFDEIQTTINQLNKIQKKYNSNSKSCFTKLKECQYKFSLIYYNQVCCLVLLSLLFVVGGITFYSLKMYWLCALSVLIGWVGCFVVVFAFERVGTKALVIGPFHCFFFCVCVGDGDDEKRNFLDKLNAVYQHNKVVKIVWRKFSEWERIDLEVKSIKENSVIQGKEGVVYPAPVSNQDYNLPLKNGFGTPKEL